MFPHPMIPTLVLLALGTCALLVAIIRSKHGRQWMSLAFRIRSLAQLLKVVDGRNGKLTSGEQWSGAQHSPVGGRPKPSERDRVHEALVADDHRRPGANVSFDPKSMVLYVFGVPGK